MVRHTPSFTRPDTLLPSTPLFRSRRSGMRRHAGRQAGYGALESGEEGRPVDRRQEQELWPVGEQRPAECCGAGGGRDAAEPELLGLLVEAHASGGADLPPPIGRAPCWERVCQYG